MEEQKSKIIFDTKYIATLKSVVDHILFYDEFDKAAPLLKKLSRAVDDHAAELRAMPDVSAFYANTLLSLRFISLPLLEDKDVIQLIKNNFIYQFSLKNYLLTTKLSNKFLNIIEIEERNILKESLKKALLENSEIITKSGDIKFIKDWIKNYLSKVGLDLADKLAKAQYLSDLKNNKNITPVEYEKLTALFNVYDLLNTPSDTPQGFEEEPPISINGKLYIFRKGVLEEVPTSDFYDEVDSTKKDAGNFIDLDNDDEKELSSNKSFSDSAVTSKKDALASPAPVAILKPESASSMPVNHRLVELEGALKLYPSDSLEHKALRQEISRLKKLALKK